MVLFNAFAYGFCNETLACNSNRLGPNILYLVEAKKPAQLFFSPIGCPLAFLQGCMLFKNVALRPLMEAIEIPAICA